MDRNYTLPIEIACYSLPYGGLGFTSHILTYYTVICLGFGRKPFWPCKPISQGNFDLFLAVAGLLVGFIISTITMVRCRNHWQLVAIAVWKLGMSLFNNIVGVHIAWANIQDRRDAQRAAAIATRDYELHDIMRDLREKKYPAGFLWFGICWCLSLSHFSLVR